MLMAEIGIIERFHASHGTVSHEHDFKVEIVIEGKINKETGFVEGIDHHEAVSVLKNIISEIKDKDLKIILTEKGYRSSGNESIASYFLRSLKEKFPVKCVKIWETENKYAVVFSEDI